MKLLTFGETPLRLSPPGHEPFETARELTVHADGTESNAAATAAALGADATWVSTLPDTPLGRRVVSELDRYGVETAVTWADGRQGLQFHERGAFPREQATYHDREDTAAATATSDELPLKNVRNADAALTGASTLALSDQITETGKTLLEVARGSGAVTATDIDHQPGLASPETIRATVERVFEYTDVVFVSEKQARSILGLNGQPRDVGLTLADEHDLELVVILRPECNAVALDDSPGTNVVNERRATGTETVDPTGHRGAFVGAFLERYAAGADTTEALSHGVAASSLVRTVPGPFLTAGPAELARTIEHTVEAPR
jgi:2-dehydro-3-deoxygluconokinase